MEKLSLDVGCGNKPRGDVNVDLYISDKKHRKSIQFAYCAPLDPKRIPNLVRADVHFLPFRDEMFDEVYCFDLLEHKGVVPKIALQELMRCSKRRVFFSVPSFWDWRQNPKRNKAHNRLFRRRDISKLCREYPHEIEVQRWTSLTPFVRLLRVTAGYKVTLWKPISQDKIN